MIKQGLAAAFDFKLLLSYMVIMGLGLTAACIFGGGSPGGGSPKSSESGAAPAIKMPGG